MLQYYTLEQAAKLLNANADKAKKLLDDQKVRQYRDGRGGVRYVASAVDELARTLGLGSDPELPLGEAPRAKGGSTPRPNKAAKSDDPADSTFNFDLPLDDSEDVAIGREPLDASASASKKASRSGTQNAGAKGSPRTPAPKAGSDSDVRLVTEGNDLDFQISVDSDVKMVDEAAASAKPGASGKRKPTAADTPGDSGVRIVPMDGSESDVKITDNEEGSVVLDRPPGKKHSDSDIRLEEVARTAPRADQGSDDALVTEEIDLDAEARKHAEKAKGKGARSKMKRVDSSPALPTTSPFELSEDDLSVPAGPKKKKPDSSSDFELTPGVKSDDAIELTGSDEKPALPKKKGIADDSSEEEVALGELSGQGAGNSGINLDAPMDSGISLEGGEGSGDEMEFELSLDAGSTPKPASKAAPKPGAKPGKPKVAKVEEPEDSDSEFELTLDADSSAEQPVLQSAAQAGEAGEDSDSEFELTLDDSGGLVPMEAEKAAAAGEAEDGDIFETDFEVPALDEESGSEAVALNESDTDLESSDFNLALEEGDAAAEDESGSQVVALEDEADAAAETVQRPSKKKGKPAARKAAAADEEDVDPMLDAGDEEPLEELADVEDEDAVGDEDDSEDQPQRRVAVAAGAAAPVPWGPMPALVLLPCLVVMLLAGLMGFELINTMFGYRQPGKVSGFLTESLAKTFDLKLPKE